MPPNILDQIEAVAGPLTPEAPWVAGDDTEEFLLSDQAIDWIEEAANAEGSAED